MGFPVLAYCQCGWQGVKIGKSPRAEASRDSVIRVVRLDYRPTLFFRNPYYYWTCTHIFSKTLPTGIFPQTLSSIVIHCCFHFASPKDLKWNSPYMLRL